MFVIPMAGLSSRFFKAGYTKPKHQLVAHGDTLFAHAVESFSHYFAEDRFLFVLRSDHDTQAFVQLEAERLGIRDFDLVVLDRETAGQAETVALALQKYNSEPLYIFNIDTFRPRYRKPEFCAVADGYLETFIGSGKNWSNIKPLSARSDRVKRTAEKQEISEYCCTGLYHWGSADLYCRYYEEYSRFDANQLDAGERYVAPMYNLAIRDGHDIRFSVIGRDEVTFCGTPDEYTDFLSN